MWLLSYSVSNILSMNEVLCILPYGDHDGLSHWKRVSMRWRLRYTADGVEEQTVKIAAE